MQFLSTSNKVNSHRTRSPLLGTVLASQILELDPISSMRRCDFRLRISVEKDNLKHLDVHPC